MAKKSGILNAMARQAKRNATNATKQMMYYAVWHEPMPAKKRIVKDTTK